LLRKPFAILSLSAAATVGGALLSAGVASAASAPASAVTASAPATYTVQPGDTLWAIGQRFGISMQNLAAANNMGLNDTLFAGRVLTVSGSAAPASSTTPTPAASTTASTTSSSASVAPSSGLERCVINSESHGDAQITNSSGHWGLYQFSESTWEAYGGSASDFGSASPAQQHQVFANAIARGGASNWTAYDGC
jgi:LysM repeat protein